MPPEDTNPASDTPEVPVQATSQPVTSSGYQSAKQHDWLNKFPRSPKTLALVFVGLFAVVGTAALLLTNAAASPIASLEAEAMTLPSGTAVISDSAASGTQAIKFSTNGTATGSISLPSTADSITIRAKGDQCKGSPSFSLSIDGGASLGSKSASSTSWTDYTYTKSLAAGSHTIALSFTNYSTWKNCRKALYVDKVTFNGTVVVVDNTPPTQPTGMTATPKSATQIDLSWQPSSDDVGVTGYDVYRSTGGETATKITTVTAANYSDTGLTASTAYSYSVIARDAANNSSVTSTAVTATTASATAAVGQMFITTAELNSKPTSGPGWTFLKSKADLASYGAVSLSDLNSLTQSNVLAGALVYARDPIANASYKDKVIAAIKAAPGTEISRSCAATDPDLSDCNQSLRLGRTLYGYVVAADLVQMPYSTVANNGETWQAFLERIRTTTIPGNSRWPTLEITSADTSSNWGAYELSSHLAVSYALNDTVAIQRDLDIFKRFLGDTTSPAAPFKPTMGYRHPTSPLTSSSNGLTWDTSDNFPTLTTIQRGINPASSPDGLSGALVEDVLRYTSGGGDSIACCVVQKAGVDYQAETLDGILSTAQLFRAHGVDLRSFQDDALKRAYNFYVTNGGPSSYTLTRYMAYNINYLYGTTYPTLTEDRPFRHMGYGSWLFTR